MAELDPVVIEVSKSQFGAVDVLVHSIAFSPEIKNLAINTSRGAYLTALSISAYSPIRT